MCYRSKTWQSHDQRHLIILELHCSFNPSERTIFYWGEGENNVGVANTARKAVTSCWKCSLLNVAWHFWGSRWRRQYKASLCVWRMVAELMDLETQMCHKSLSTQHWIVLLFFSWGLWGSWLVECDQTTISYIWHTETESKLRKVWANIPWMQDGLSCFFVSFTLYWKFTLICMEYIIKTCTVFWDYNGSEARVRIMLKDDKPTT